MERQFLRSLMMSLWEGLFLFLFFTASKTTHSKASLRNDLIIATECILSVSRHLALSFASTHTHTHTCFCVTLLEAAVWHLLSFFRNILALISGALSPAGTRGESVRARMRRQNISRVLFPVSSPATSNPKKIKKKRRDTPSPPLGALGDSFSSKFWSKSTEGRIQRHKKR